MDKYIFDKSNGLWYELVSDYYFPCLTVPAEEEQAVGVWGQRHKQLSGKLNGYLADIDQQAQEMEETLIQKTAERHGISESLKATDQMAWIGLMNNCKAQVEEIIFSDLIYV